MRKTNSFDLEKFRNGRSSDAYRYFGSHREGGSTVFRVWAPRAKSISLVGDFNSYRPTR